MEKKYITNNKEQYEDIFIFKLVCLYSALKCGKLQFPINSYKTCMTFEMAPKMNQIVDYLNTVQEHQSWCVLHMPQVKKKIKRFLLYSSFKNPKTKSIPLI